MLLPLGCVLAGPAAAQFGTADVLLGGAILGFAALALGLLPRETRMLERLDVQQPTHAAHAEPRSPAGAR